MIGKASPKGGSTAPEPAGQLASAGARHVAIIMDGNGRWAKKRHLPRLIGHQRGVEAVRRLVRAARHMGLEALTLYAFSTENWRRPEDEISDLMALLKRFILADLDEFAANDVRLKIIGDYRAFPADVVELIDGAGRALRRTPARPWPSRSTTARRTRSPAPPPRPPPRARSRPRRSKPSSIRPACRRSTS